MNELDVSMCTRARHRRDGLKVSELTICVPVLLPLALDNVLAENRDDLVTHLESLVNLGSISLLSGDLEAAASLIPSGSDCDGVTIESLARCAKEALVEADCPLTLRHCEGHLC